MAYNKRNAVVSKKTKGSFFDWVDISLKIVIALIGISISYLGYSYQKTSTASLLLVQQEKGDTNIRAQMFGKITDRLMKPTNNEDSLLQDVLLAQVLALNFHELIELKPLMISLDNQLNRKIKDDNRNQASDYEEAQDNLRSVARRVRDRQVAALIHNPRPKGVDAKLKSTKATMFDWLIKDEEDKNIGAIHYVSVLRNGKQDANTCSVREGEGKNGCVKEVMEIPGPSTDVAMYISIDDAKWEQETFIVSFNSGIPLRTIKLPKDGNGKYIEGEKITKCDEENKDDDNKSNSQPKVQTGHKSFNLSWYDFPYTDNTLLANGNRHAIFIDRICKDLENIPAAVRLGILYFPKDYYPSRERPVSYKQLKKKMEWGNES